MKFELVVERWVLREETRVHIDHLVGLLAVISQAEDLKACLMMTTLISSAEDEEGIHTLQVSDLWVHSVFLKLKIFSTFKSSLLKESLASEDIKFEKVCFVKH
jgi:hypothetical protein